ncbi:phenylalanyl-tRNA synthetase [Exidia glandulosa HHB12029]|uniref:Phenylalanine--tRNA ligase beta subunit n=1 Tax=Exidia glandulosa HHB12029 TaxID=1314781 RepID=A0A165QUX4_EXIGL|nr:phenylalanyl-tRNA synthetase [Exidia glandulosa HHB12029]
MPTVAIDKQDLWDRLGKEYTTDEFDKLCFDFGIELDEDTTEEVEKKKKLGQPAERPQLKIEIPANRYDLLCIEGIARSLRVFLGKEKAPIYRLKYPVGGDDKLLTLKISKDCLRVRPFFAGAVLRNIRFTQRSYESFIDLQDKLHHNIGRRRILVSMGTHDLDTITPPFSYEALPPTEIEFVPLNQTKKFRADQLMAHYKTDRQLSKYLHIIEDSPVYPIIYDSKRVVASMPPIINSEHSKITLNTRNVFLDVTATDQTKLDIVLNMLVTMFSEYCEEPFTIEPIRVVLPDGTSKVTPDLAPQRRTAHASYINACTGLSLPPKDIAELLNRMTLSATTSPTEPDQLLVEVPPTRPDILHECDIMEDAAIAYGFNNLPRTFPPTNTVAQPLAISKLCDLVRREWAQAGWVEALPLILCSHEENFAWLNRHDDGTQVVRLANPKTLEFQVVRTSLLPGLLKTIRENRNHALPVRIFETADVVFKDPTVERQARNERHAAAVWCNKTAGFEVIHGLLDRIMQMLEIPKIASTDRTAQTGYYIAQFDDPTFFPGRAAQIYYRPSSSSSSIVLEAKTFIGLRDVPIGTLGILHPTVLQNFEIGYPCSALEFDLTPFQK